MQENVTFVVRPKEDGGVAGEGLPAAEKGKRLGLG